MKNKKITDTLLNIIPSVISVLLGTILGWFILHITNPTDSLAGIGTVLLGGFNEGIAGIGNVIYAATPIILTGLSVGFGMKTGLFNIGASGQFTAGAFTAILIGVKCTFLPAVIHTVVAVIGGIAAGMLWGAVSGLLKAYCKVNEVISGIMLNYTAMLLANLLIRSLIYDEGNNRSADVAPSAVISKNTFDFLLPGSNISLAFFAVLFAAGIVKVMLDKTTVGYQLKTTGRNPHAAYAAGINTKMTLSVTLAISGALAGLGGALMYLSDFGDHIEVTETVLEQGFTGISVALLGFSEPIGIIFSGLFIAYITVGGNYLQLYSYTPDVIDMIIAAIVFCGAFTVPVKLVIQSLINKKNNVREEGKV